MQSPNETSIPQSGHAVNQMNMLAYSLGSNKLLETETRCFVDSKGNVLPIEVPVTTVTSEQQRQHRRVSISSFKIRLRHTVNIMELNFFSLVPFHIPIYVHDVLVNLNKHSFEFELIYAMQILKFRSS